jgi:ABC-type Zn2+ transport system substrate-binding protein/surface adhesin
MIKKAADAENDKKHAADYGDSKNADAASDTCDQEDDTAKAESNDKEDETDSGEDQCKTWLQVLPAKGGLLLAALLVEIMTEGMTPTQMNILGNFIASVGTLISYKASRNDID